MSKIENGAHAGADHVPGLEPVGDRDLAELLARLADAWESGSERERGRIEQMMIALPWEGARQSRLAASWPSSAGASSGATRPVRRRKHRV